MPDRIQPRTLKGFRDYPPEAMLPRERLMDTARRVYRSYGYAPIDTPALEYLEVLTGKGSDETDKQLYRFQDHGGRDVGLRFDLTVPLARFAAQHAQQLGTPFKRYHIAPVWRGENTQRGRYREFVQCDFDTVGVTGLASDVETVLVVHDLMRALGIERFTIRLNHRGLLNGLLDTLGLANRSAAVLRALDKLAKMGEAKVRGELAETAGATAEQADRLLAFAALSEHEDPLSPAAEMVAGSERGEAGAERLREVVAAFAAAGADVSRLRIDPSIARGLDYYTGLVLETTLDDLPGIGSVASGGRYDDLAGLYTKQPLPGIGASLGVDRLLAALEELGLVEAVATPADVLVVQFDATQLHSCLQIAATVRSRGIGAEVYPEAKKLGKQLQYADRRGFRIALIAGPDELAAGVCQLKRLADGSSQSVELGSVGEAVEAMLNSNE